MAQTQLVKETQSRVAVNPTQTSSHDTKEEALEALKSLPQPRDTAQGYTYEEAVTSRKVKTTEGEKDQFRAYWKPVVTSIEGIRHLMGVDPVGLLEDLNSGRNTKYNNSVGAGILGEYVDPEKVQTALIKKILDMRRSLNAPISEDEARRIVESMKPKRTRKAA